MSCDTYTPRIDPKQCGRIMAERHIDAGSEALDGWSVMNSIGGMLFSGRQEAEVALAYRGRWTKHATSAPASGGPEEE